MAKFVNGQAADAELPPNVSSAPNDVIGIDQKYNIPIVFLREKEIFGDRKAEKGEWIQHIEMYRAIGTKINAAHITGLQRVRGLWRIYLDNVEDKVALMAEGVPLRGKNIPVLNTNPDRFDGEETVRVRIKNIPLSVEDGLIKRTITLKNVEVISMYREKLRVDGKLTNCETGDRIVIVKASSLKEPLPFTMSFGHFSGRVLHIGQQKLLKSVQQKCSKCLQDGHTFGACTNDWVCTLCNKSGHKRYECKEDNTNDNVDAEVTESESESSSSESSEDETDKKKRKKGAKKTKDSKDQPAQQDRRRTRKNDNKSENQQSMDKYVTPQRNKSNCRQERSPITPTEELHDKQMLKSTTKKQKNKE